MFLTLVGMSSTLPTVPGAPTLVSAEPGDAHVVVTWTAPTTGGTPTHYLVMRSLTQGGTYTQVGPSFLTPSSFTDNTVVNGTTYWYEIHCFNDFGYSVPSNTMSATPLTSPSEVPLLGDTLLGTLSATEDGSPPPPAPFLGDNPLGTP